MLTPSSDLPAPGNPELPTDEGILQLYILGASQVEIDPETAARHFAQAAAQLALKYWETLRRLVQKRLRPYAHLARMRDSTDDIAANLFLRCDHRLRRKAASVQSLGGWLWKNAIWEVREAYRQGVRDDWKPAEDDDDGDPVEDVASPLEDPSAEHVHVWDTEAELIQERGQPRLVADFRDCAEAVPNERHRDALKLCLAGLTLREIAATLGYKGRTEGRQAGIGGANSAVKSALGAIAECLKEKGWEGWFPG